MGSQQAAVARIRTGRRLSERWIVASHLRNIGARSVSFYISRAAGRFYTAVALDSDRMTELHEILYFSQLAPDQPTEVVGQIVARARARNAREGITGLLVFDGMRFCQHFEGPRGTVLKLVERLEADPRHVHMRVAYEGELLQRRYRAFDLGLAQIEDGEDIAVVEQFDGMEAVTRFLALRPRLDI